VGTFPVAHSERSLHASLILCVPVLAADALVDFARIPFDHEPGGFIRAPLLQHLAVLTRRARNKTARRVPSPMPDLTPSTTSSL
jgi:hypothetical protein